MQIRVLIRSSVFVSFVIFPYCEINSLLFTALREIFCFGFSSVFVIFVVFPYCELRFPPGPPMMPQVNLILPLPVELIEWRALYRNRKFGK
jgi:hypothetical protein